MFSGPKRRSTLLASVIAMALLSLPTACDHGRAPTAAKAKSAAQDVSDDTLVRSLPGFKRGFAQVNGVRLHYVAGGQGEPVLLLPGWPQTWWSYHKIMPALAKRYRVIAVDIRGMGASDKPAGGYDKKTMAADIAALVRQLGYQQAHIVGHDIGSQVGFSYAANHPQATRTLTMLDVPHADDSLATWPMLPKHGTFTDKLDPAAPYPWWFAFHQVKGLPEELLEGRAHIEQKWIFRYLLKDESALDARDRAVYASAYNSRDALRAGTAWYQTFTQDIIDDRSYKPLRMPVLGLAGEGGYGWMKSNLARTAPRAQVVQLDSGHFIAEEKPAETIQHLLEFLKLNSAATVPPPRESGT